MTARTASSSSPRPSRLRQPSVRTEPDTGTGTEAVTQVNTAFLETLLGYNARRAALAVISVFLQRMAPFNLRIVDFSVLTLIAHNPGITSRQLCQALDILPPNLVGMVKALEGRGLLEKREHPTDRRAQGLHLTSQGAALQGEAQDIVASLETESVTHLTEDERDTLIRLLRKVYLPNRR